MELQLNRRRGRGVTRFLVRWRGHTPADDEWLRHCRHKVAEYDAAGPRRRAGLRDAPTPPAAAPPPPPSAAAQPPLAAAQATPPLAAPPLVVAPAASGCRLALLGRTVLYYCQWPGDGWFLGMMVRCSRTQGFSHVVW